MDALFTKTVLIVGAGRSGLAAFRLLKEHGQRAILFDDHIEAFKQEISLDEIGALILSPGIDRIHPLVKKSIGLNIPVLNEMDLASLFLPRTRMIGITGTNGKSTTTVMLESMFKSAGFKAVGCGNLGLPLCEIVITKEEYDFLLIELSSFQLESLSLLKLDAALILNITPDHLDRYPSFVDYKNAKFKIASLLKPDGKLFLNRELKALAYETACYFSHADVEYLPIKSSVLGEHNQENALGAFLVAKHFGLNEDEIVAGLKSFKALPHRCELLGEHEGITYINDSKGTTVVAVSKALAMVKGPVHLLLGGIEKGEDFSVLSTKNFPNIKGYYIYGRATEKIALDLSSPLALTYPDLKAAMLGAKAKASVGDTILLSPGCASYDQFDNYAHRGDVFKQLFKQI